MAASVYEKSPPGQAKESRLLSECHNTYKASGHRVSGHGIGYAELVAMMVYLKGGSVEGLEFCLASEMDAAEKFDDLVLQYRKPGGGMCLHFIQIKHRSNDSSRITAQDLKNVKSGDFSLRKYFVSFLKIKRNPLFDGSVLEEFLIWTNATFQLRKLEESKIGVMEITASDNILNLAGTKDKIPIRYKLVVDKEHELYSVLREAYTEVATTGEADEETGEFFDKLVFAMNQPNLKQIEVIVKEEISSLSKPKHDATITNIIYSQLKCEISKWIADSNATFLSHVGIGEFLARTEEQIVGKIWFEVGHLVDSFTGREEELNALDESLFRGSVEAFTIITQMGSVSGLGGIGKTELARKYAHHRAADFNFNVVWINAESHDTMTASFSRLAKDKLKISLVDAEGGARVIKLVVDEVYQFFAKKKCLFVFDNAEKLESETEGDAGINKFLVSLPPGHQLFTLITSRNQDWGKCEPIILDKFKPEEAAAFIRMELNIEEGAKDGAINELSELLDNFPLALCQAVSYIKEEAKNWEVIGEKFQIKDYIALYNRKSGKDKILIDYKPSDKRPFRYLQTIYTTWQVTQDIIKNKPNGDLALKILNIMAYIQPDNIHVKQMFSKLVDDISELGPAILLLRNYSMVTSGVDKGMLNIHRLVQEVTRLKLKGQVREEEVLKYALNLLHDENVVECVDHFQEIWNFACNYKELVETFSNAPSAVVKALETKIRFKNAYDFGLKCINCLIDILGEDHLSCLDLRNKFAGVLECLGKDKEANEIYRQTYQQQRDILGADNPTTLATRRSFASTLQNQGNYKEALDIFEEIFHGLENLYAPDSPHILLTKHDIASNYEVQGKFHEALQMYTEVFEKRLEIFGADNSLTLNTKHNIACVLESLGKYEDAHKIFSEIYLKECDAQGPDHPSTLTTKHNIAFIYEKQCKHDEALEIYQQVHEKRRDILGADHPKTLVTKHNIASLLEIKGKYDEAYDMFNEIYRKECFIQGSNHPCTLTTEHNIAFLLEKMGKYEEAMCMYSQIVKKRRDILGADHPKTLTTQNNIASLLSVQGKYNQAYDMFNEIYNRECEIQGPNHPGTLVTKHNIAYNLKRQGKYREAIDIFEQVLVVECDQLGPEHPSTLTTKYNIATILEILGKYKEALEMFKDVYHKRCDVLGANHPDTLTAMKRIDSLGSSGQTYMC